MGTARGLAVPQVNPNAKRREALEARVEAEGVGALHEELRLLDAEVAARIDGRNPRRVVRALEVALSRDVDASEGGKAQGPRKNPPDYDAMVVG